MNPVQPFLHPCPWNSFLSMGSPCSPSPGGSVHSQPPPGMFQPIQVRLLHSHSSQCRNWKFTTQKFKIHDAEIQTSKCRSFRYSRHQRKVFSFSSPSLLSTQEAFPGICVFIGLYKSPRITKLLPRAAGHKLEAAPKGALAERIVTEIQQDTSGGLWEWLPFGFCSPLKFCVILFPYL